MILGEIPVFVCHFSKNCGKYLMTYTSIKSQYRINPTDYKIKRFQESMNQFPRFFNQRAYKEFLET